MSLLTSSCTGVKAKPEELSFLRSRLEQHMQQETVEELLRRHCHGALPVAMGIVLPAEANTGIGNGD
jgi:hypothetical protein